MDACKRISEKIIFFEDLSRDAQQEVKDHTEHCDSCRKHFEQIQAIMVSLGQQPETHVMDDESLLRYSIYLSAPKETDYHGRKLSSSEIVSVREHIDECGSCRKKVDQYCEEFQEIEEYLEEAELPSLSLAGNLYWTKIHEKARTSWNNVYKSARESLTHLSDLVRTVLSAPTPRLVPIAVGVTATLLVVVWAGPFFRGDDPYHELAALGQEEVSLLTRGALPEELSEGLSAFQEGDYGKSVQDLEGFVSDNATNPSLYYAHYALGISYLFEARTDFLGRFQEFDSGVVDKGIQNLELARNITDNPGMKEDCLWYMAKGYLVKRDGRKARETYERIISLQGRRFNEARQAIERIDNLSGSQ